MTLADCIALGSTRYKAHVWNGEKIETPGKEPQTMGCFGAAVKQEILLCTMMYGTEHKRERRKAIGELIRSHDRKPELSTVQFSVLVWNRLRYEYTEVIRDGDRAMIRLLPNGSSRDAFVSLALSPFENSRKRLWRWPDVFSFTSPSGMWKGRILPDVEEHKEFARISGSASLRSAPPVVDTSTNIPDAGKRRKKTKKEKERTAPLRAALPMQFLLWLARTPLILGVPIGGEITIG